MQSHARVNGEAHRVEAECPHTEHSLSNCTQQPCLHLCNSSPLALPKQSQLLPPLCSEPSQVSPLTQSSQGAVSLLSSAQLPLWSPLLPATFSLTVFPPKVLSCYSSNIPDPFSPQALYSLFVSSSCKGSSPISKWLALSSPSSVWLNSPCIVTSTLTILFKCVTRPCTPPFLTPCILAYFPLWRFSPFHILCVMTSLLYLL